MSFIAQMAEYVTNTKTVPNGTAHLASISPGSTLYSQTYAIFNKIWRLQGVLPDGHIHEMKDAEVLSSIVLFNNEQMFLFSYPSASTMK